MRSVPAAMCSERCWVVLIHSGIEISALHQPFHVLCGLASTGSIRCGIEELKSMAVACVLLCGHGTVRRLLPCPWTPTQPYSRHGKISSRPLMTRVNEASAGRRPAGGRSTEYVQINRLPSDITAPSECMRHPAVCYASEPTDRKKSRRGPMSFSPGAGFTDEAGTNNQPRQVWTNRRMT
jgi:hypothetical protein